MDKLKQPCLAEKWIFLIYFQTIIYSQTSYGGNSFHFVSRRSTVKKKYCKISIRIEGLNNEEQLKFFKK